MSYRTVDAARGVQWLVEGTQLVFRNPAVFLVQALIVVLISIVPVLGQLAAIVLFAVFLAGMVYSLREEDEGRRADIGQVFAGFQQPNKLGPLVALCLPAVVGVVVIVVLGFVLVGGSLLAAIFSGGGDPGAAAALGLGGGLLLFMVLCFAVALAIYALIVFAIPRVMFDAVEPFEAMQESIRASLANLVPLLVFSLVFFVAFLIVFAVLSLIPFLGSIVALLLGHAITAAAIYVAYKDVFEPARAPVIVPTVIVPPPPPPPGPPGPPTVL